MKDENFILDIKNLNFFYGNFHALKILIYLYL